MGYRAPSCSITKDSLWAVDVLKESGIKAHLFSNQKLLNQWRNNLAGIRYFDEDLKATISLGVAVFPQDAQTAQELIDKADWSLYRAKETGRNMVCVYGVFK